MKVENVFPPSKSRLVEPPKERKLSHARRKAITPGPYSAIPYPWMYKTKQEIQDWIDRTKLRDAFITKEQEIDCADRISFWSWKEVDYVKERILVKYKGKLLFPVKFNIVQDFDTDRIPIDSLVGLPRVVFGSLRFYETNIQTFDGFPKMVMGDVSGGTKKVLKSFEGLEDVVLKHDLLTFDLGAGNKSVKGLPHRLKGLDLRGKVTTLSGINEVCPNLEKMFIGRESTCGVLSLLKIDTFRELFSNGNNEKVAEIVNKHLSSERDIIACKRDLISAGFNYAARF